MSNAIRQRLADAKVGWVPLIIAFGGLLLSFLPFQSQLEEGLGLGLLYVLRGPETPPDNVVIVGIDHESALRLQAPDDPQEWPRRLHAGIIRNTQELAAELVAFNIFFSGPSTDTEADREMAEAMREMGGVVLTEYVKPRHVLAGVYVESEIEPTAELASAALATAPFLLPKGSTGAGEFLTFFGDEDKRATLPTLLLLAFALRTGFDDLSVLLARADPALAAFLRTYASNREKPTNFNLIGRKLATQLRARPSLSTAFQKAVESHGLPEPKRRMLNSLVRVFREEGVRYFNHYGPARIFRTIPYDKLANTPPDVAKNSLQDKIVLVGYLEDFQPETTEGLFYTPYSPISSVELAATAIANLLEDKSVRPAFSPLFQALWIFLWGSGLGLCAQLLSVQRGLGLIVLLGAGYLLIAWLMFRADGTWLPIIVPLGWQIPAALAGSLSLSYLQRARRERKMQSVIQRFIPVDVFSHLTRHEDNNTLPAYGRMAQGVCLATDAGRYTALAETMEPMALALLINAYYEAIFEPVTRRGGWISDVVGDAMLAIWIVEGNDDKVRREALTAALEIQQAVRRFEETHGLEFPIRIGIHYGALRIGYVGTANRGEIRAVGDTVNTAARLEALNKLLGTQILVSESVLQDLEQDGIRPLGQFLLAGKVKPVSVAELLIGAGDRKQADELHARFHDALDLFLQERWSEAHAAFTLLTLQFPEDGPTRFYHNACQSYLADPTLGMGTAGIRVGKPELARIARK